MKKLIISLTFSFFFVLLFFLGSNQILAQDNTAHCRVEGTGATEHCVLVNNCNPGCTPTVSCDVSVDICSETHEPCDCEPPPPPANCVRCPGGVCGGPLPCCYPCVEDDSIQGTCHCQIPTPTPTPATTPSVGCNGICRRSDECTADPDCTECRFNRLTRTNICIDPENPPAGTDDQPVEGGPIHTAIGDIDPRNLQGFIQSLLGIAFGVAGGIAFLLMLFGSFQIMTSSGNPEKMKAGSELITSALTGLLFIVFSVFLLKLIGVDILQIPGFNK